MVHVMIDMQPLFLGLLLAWTGGYKLLGRGPAGTAAEKLLGGAQRARIAFRAVGAVEAVVAVLLLTPPTVAVDGLLAAGLGAGFVGYLVVARRVAPTSSCGCMSSHAGPVTWRSYARAGLVVLAGLVAATAATSWTSRLVDSPGVLLAGLALESLVLVAISPDLDRVWLLRARQMWARLRPHPFAATAADSDEAFHASVWRLHHSAAYRAAVPLLRSDVLDTWLEGSWRMVTYSAERDGTPMTAVFAIPHPDLAEEIRLALVEQPPEEVAAPTGTPVLAPA